MAFLKSKKNKESEAVVAKEAKTKKVVVKAETAAPKAASPSTAGKFISQSIHRTVLHPRITEKASSMVEAGVYTFNVSVLANKRSVKEEIARIYKVTPVKISITKVPGKVLFTRGKKGSRKAGKKAYVTLKKGETIEFV